VVLERRIIVAVYSTCRGGPNGAVLAFWARGPSAAQCPRRSCAACILLARRRCLDPWTRPSSQPSTKLGLRDAAVPVLSWGGGVANTAGQAGRSSSDKSGDIRL